MLKKLLHIILICVMLSGLQNHILGQATEVTIGAWDKLPALNEPRQEKLYLHFDKPYYASGERMWFRAYLQDATTLKPDTAETTIYVELINARDSIIYREKIQRIEGAFYGNFYLNELLPEGIYRVKAYSNFMRNAGESYFFQQAFFIGNNLSSEVRTSVKFNFITPKNGLAEIKFMKKSNVLSLKDVSYKLNVQGKKSKKIRTETTTDGFLKVEFNPIKIRDKKPSITVYYEDSVSKYERTYLIPTKNEFDVQIFPEGGEIVNGATNSVAFKAVKTDGLSVDVSGTLFDGDNQKVCDFKSEHLGMGKFIFLTDEYKSYYAIFKTNTGDTKRISLPKPHKDAFALGAVSKHGRILIYVRSEKNRMIKDSLTVIGHMNGKIFSRNSVTGFTPSFVFDTKELPAGIAHFVLFDKENTPISERIVFVRPRRMATLSVDFLRIAVGKRERINCVLDATDSKGNPIINGSFSVSVTDGLAVKPDSGMENILSRLLISSDLKGYIEKPGLYFNPNYKNADEAIDLLMMTQGWKRFSFDQALKNEKYSYRFPVEKGYTLSGKVISGKNNGMRGIQVIAFAPIISYFKVLETDKNGEFSFKDLYFQDKTQFTLVARRKKSIKEELRFDIKDENNPEVGEFSFPAENIQITPDEYMKVANEKYFNENGTRNVYAKNRGLISFTPQKLIEEIKNPPISYSTENYVIEGPALEKYKDESLESLLKKIPVLKAWNEQIQPKTPKEGNSHQEVIVGPLFSIDGNIYSYNEIQYVKLNELESVRIMQATDASKLPGTDNSTLIDLSFKQKNPYSSYPDKQNILAVMPLGYADNIKFYEPKYEFFNDRTNPLPDWRSTLTFIPQLTTGTTGKALFSFFATDRVVPYNIVVEGISPDGEPCRFTTTRMLLSKEYLHEVK